jgi:hypothetical protein
MCMVETTTKITMYLAFARLLASVTQRGTP